MQESLINNIVLLQEKKGAKEHRLYHEDYHTTAHSLDEFN